MRVSSKDYPAVVWQTTHSPTLIYGFSTSALLKCGARWFFVVGGCSVHCRIFSRIPGLYPLGASSTPSSSWNNHKCLQTWLSPRGKISLVESQLTDFKWPENFQHQTSLAYLGINWISFGKLSYPAVFIYLGSWLEQSKGQWIRPFGVTSPFFHDQSLGGQPHFKDMSLVTTGDSVRHWCCVRVSPPELVNKQLWSPSPGLVGQ